MCMRGRERKEAEITYRDRRSIWLEPRWTRGDWNSLGNPGVAVNTILSSLIRRALWRSFCQPSTKGVDCKQILTVAR